MRGVSPSLRVTRRARRRCVGIERLLAEGSFCSYNILANHLRSGEARQKTRGLDFEDASLVFSGRTVEIKDTRKDYGERRIICYGMLAGRLVVIGYTVRGADRHIFGMRKANEREKARLAPYFEV